MSLQYQPLSENGGVIIDSFHDAAIRLMHDEDGSVIYQICEKGERPTIVNKEFADAWIGNPEFRLSPPSEFQPSETKTPKYQYFTPNADTMTPEYQLYLANELERETNRKNSKMIKDIKNALPELTGLLPHEEEQDVH